jgi:hypothetical protein
MLEGYSRAILKFPENTKKLDTLIYLPISAWPKDSQNAFEAFKSKLRLGKIETDWNGFISSIGDGSPKFNDFMDFVDREGIGIEPTFKKLPNSDARLVAFFQDRDSLKHHR